jgi:hypothetical protein
VAVGESQILELVILAIPVATVSWAVTHEEILREFRDWCAWRSNAAGSVLARKLFYIFTCEFCFSFYVAIGAVSLTRFHLLYDRWQGYGVAVLSLVWLANVYMSVFARLRLDIKRERVEIADREEERDAPEALRR